MIDPISPDQCQTKHYIKRKDELASRLFHSAIARCEPQPEDLAKALAFVGQYRKKYGYARRNCKLERACLGMETVLAVSLSGWITHRDGLHKIAIDQLLGLEATAA